MRATFFAGSSEWFTTRRRSSNRPSSCQTKGLSLYMPASSSELAKVTSSSRSSLKPGMSPQHYADMPLSAWSRRLLVGLSRGPIASAAAGCPKGTGVILILVIACAAACISASSSHSERDSVMPTVRKVCLAAAFTAGTVALAACAGNPGSSAWVTPQSGNPQRAHGLFVGSGHTSKIQHVVILVQENRPFNHLFMGYPGATTQNYGYISTGKKVKLQSVTLEANFIPGYGLGEFFTQCNGTGSIPGTNCQINGFDKVPTKCGKPGCPIQYPPYSYVEPSEITPYWDLAKQYVLADQMYASNIDEISFISHQYVIAAQAMGSYNWPSTEYWGCEGPPGNSVPILGQERIPTGQRQVVCFP